MKLVTGEQLKVAMIEANIATVLIHHCAICNEGVYYIRKGEDIYFDGSCDCAQSQPVPRTWESIADWINGQRNKAMSAVLARDFGIKVVKDEHHHLHHVGT